MNFYFKLIFLLLPVTSVSPTNVTYCYEAEINQLWQTETLIVYSEKPGELSRCLEPWRKTKRLVVALYKNGVSLTRIVQKYDRNSNLILVHLTLATQQVELNKLSKYLDGRKAEPSGMLWSPWYVFIPTRDGNVYNRVRWTDRDSLLHQRARVFPLHSSVYWVELLPEDVALKANWTTTTTTTTTEKPLSRSLTKRKKSNVTEVAGTAAPIAPYLIWETYSLKNVSWVRRICDSRRTSVSCFRWFTERKWERRKDFGGNVVTATAVDDPVYYHEAKLNITQDGNTTTVMFEGQGSAVEYYRLMRDRSNFRSGSRFLSEAVILGEYMLEGEPGGTPEMQVFLMNNSADIAITESGMSVEKAQVVHFLHATTAARLEASLTHIPQMKWKFFLSPFSRNVWYVVIAYCILFAVAMTTAKIMLSSKFRQGVEAVSHMFSLSHLSLLWSVGTLCQIGYHKWPKKSTMKILLVVASGSGFMLLTAYSAELTSQLAVKEPISITFENLLNTSFSYYMENDFAFPADTDKYKVKVNILYGIEESISAIKQLVNEPKTALISYPDFFYAVTITFGKMPEAEVCDFFTRISTSYYPVLCAMAVKKWSPFKEPFNSMIIRSFQHGTWSRTTRIYNLATRISCEDTPEVIPQNIGELAIAYLALFGGYAFALLLLGVEWIWFKMTYSSHADKSITCATLVPFRPVLLVTDKRWKY